MQRLLIVDASQAYTDALEGTLKNEFEILVSHDGEDALQKLNAFQPDALVINLMLPHKDGLAILNESQHRPRIILAITTIVTPYIEYAACSAGVQFLMITPTVSSLRARLLDMVDCPLQEDPVAQIIAHLRILKFPTHLTGYRQLYMAISIYAHNPNILLSKELYPAVAQYFELSDARAVEHSIRQIIDAAWKRRDPVVWAKYFPPAPDGYFPRPTNKAFISTIANRLKTQNPP